jgi:hypothetical protein
MHLASRVLNVQFLLHEIKQHVNHGNILSVNEVEMFLSFVAFISSRLKCCGLGQIKELQLKKTQIQYSVNVPRICNVHKITCSDPYSYIQKWL